VSELQFTGVPTGVREGGRLIFGIRARSITMSAPPGSRPRRRGSPSLVPRRGRHEVVVHRTVAENAAGTQFPMLTHTNYQEWVMLMQVNFEAAGLVARRRSRGG
jgi:hypothetical protein